MELIKVKVLPPEKEDWIVKVGGQEVPLSVIATLLRPFLILAILYCAYVVGQTDQLSRECNEKIAAANMEISKCAQAGHTNTYQPLNFTHP